MSSSLNPGRANQISSIRSEDLPGDQRPEAAYDKSSPASGACLCLVKTLSPSPPLCWGDMLSFQASRWLFVYNDPLIFLCPPAWFLILPLLCCCAALLIAWSDGRTDSCSQQRTNKRKRRRKRTAGRMTGEKRTCALFCRCAGNSNCCGEELQNNG